MAKRAAMFRPRPTASRQDVKRASDQRRGSARSRGYNGRWETARAVYLGEHPLCIGCEAVGEVVVATVVDHVMPHGGDEALFWDADNWQACCRWHHDVIKQRLEARWRAHRLRSAELRLDGAAAIAETRLEGRGSGRA